MASEFAAFTNGPSFGQMASKPIASVTPSSLLDIPFNIVRELVGDVAAGGKVAVATAGELAGLLGMSAPLTYDDLTTRDIKGATMLAAMGLGGLVGAGASSLLGVGQTVLSRAGMTALSEAAAGAAFGLISPLDEGQSRAGSVALNAATGGAFGAGASFIKSGAMAALSARQGAIKAAGSKVAWKQALEHSDSEKIAREVAGVSLRNAETGERMGVRRTMQPDGSMIIETTLFNTPAAGKQTVAADLARLAPSAITVRSPAGDFGSVIAEAIRNGFTEELRPWDPTRALSGLEGKLDKPTLDLIAKSNGDITQAIGLAEVNKYQAVRQAAALNEESMRLYSTLVGEIAAPGNFLGEPVLPTGVMADLQKELKLTAKQAADMGPSGVLREAIRQGFVDINNLADGMSIADFTDELALNDQIGSSAIFVSKRKDAFLTSVLLPTRIAKFFPEIAPLQQAGDLALQGLEVAMRPRYQWLHDLQERISPEAAAAARDIIDSNLRVRLDPATGLPNLAMDETRAAIRAAASATGNSEIIDFTTSVMPVLEQYLARTQEIALARTPADQMHTLGLLPLFNANRWKLNVTSFGDGPTVEWGSFHATRDEAIKEIERVRQINPKIAGTLAPKSLTWSRDSLIEMTPEALKGADTSLISAHTVSFKPGVDPKTLVLPQRAVLLRDFGEDPFEALSTYIYNAERTVQLTGFENVAKPIIAMLPDSQGNLRAWAQQYMDDVMGRPRQAEIWFDHLMERMGLDVKPRALRRYTSAIRRWETVSRLGGVFSGVVNLTQTAINTYPVLGARYTARGIGALANSSRAIKELTEAGVDLGMYMPFTAENAGFSGTAFDSFSAAFKEKRFVKAVERISLAAFNGVEKVNRLIAAWGSYQRALDQGLEKKAAGRIAQETMERTQFNYRISNMPELLRGPIGGLLLQFKSFIANEIDFIASLSPREAARFGQAVVMTGGLASLFNMPGTDVLNMASLGWSHEKLTDKLSLAPSRSGSEAEAAAWRLVAFGLPGTIHVNLADHLGLGNTSDITQGILGPAARDMLALGKLIKDGAIDISSTSGRSNISDETKRTFMAAVMPSALRRLARGVEIARTGEVRSAFTGKLLYQPDVRLREAMLTAIGAPTTEYAEQLAANEIVERTRLGYSRARTSFGKEIGLAINRGDTRAYHQVIADASAAGHLFTASEVREWSKQMRMDSNARRRTRTPVALRSDMQDLFNLTGSPLPQR